MGAGGYVIHMLVPVLLVVVAWLVLSIPVAVLVGRMLAAGHVDRDEVDLAAAVGRVPSAPDRVAYVSRVEARRSAASRWPHEARVLATSRRRVPVLTASVGRVTGDVAH